MEIHWGCDQMDLLEGLVAGSGCSLADCPNGVHPKATCGPLTGCLPSRNAARDGAKPQKVQPEKVPTILGDFPLLHVWIAPSESCISPFKHPSFMWTAGIACAVLWGQGMQMPMSGLLQPSDHSLGNLTAGTFSQPILFHSVIRLV